MASLPKTYKKLVVQQLTANFRAAVSIETVDLCKPGDGEICVKNRYVGVNASDVNISKGRYFTKGKSIPFDIGFEAVGEIAALGNGVTNVKVGDAVAYMSQKANAFAEYSCIPAITAFPIPEAKPEYLVLLVSGLTSAIGLDKSARIMNGETVLITAAAGGAGHIAVQWAKAADCHVIGTCSTDEKGKVLKDLGCDRVINYKKENLGEVLSKEYASGVDVIWETIGGEVFETCTKHLAVKGRLIVVGGISGYKEDKEEALPKLELSRLPETLLFKSASVQGFLLMHYGDCFPTYFKYLRESLESGKIRAICDFGKDEELMGMEGIIKGVEYLHSGRSIGKVMVKIS